MDFRRGRGSEQQGLRPALIIQNDIGNRYAATTIVAAITTTLKAYPVTVPLRAGEGGLRRRSMVNLTQIFTVAKDRLRRRLGILTESSIRQVDEAIKISLSLD
jgi:mRNA interferase MazF